MTRARLAGLAIAVLAALPLAAQCTLPEEKTAVMPMQQQRPLRGSVKSCTVENTRPEVTSADGKIYPEMHWQDTTETDTSGSVLVRHSGNSDGSEWVTRYSYDDSGRLLKVSSGEGKSYSETTYTYDPQGRLQQTSDGDRPPITYHYDEQGRKTQVATSRPEDYRPTSAVGAGIAFEAAGTRPNLPGGGTATTIFDDHDRATEVQVRNANGEVVNRYVRKYDEQGHVIEEKQILDNPETMFPPEVMTQIQTQTGQSIDELRQQMRAEIMKLMAGQSSPYSVSYRYDKEGRVSHISRRIFNMQHEIDTTYNEHGDIESEVMRESPIATDSDHPAPPVQPYSEARYSYQYDSHDNWIEQTVSHRSSSDAPLEASSTIKRTLTYY